MSEADETSSACQCSSSRDRQPNAILFSILSRPDGMETRRRADGLDHAPPPPPGCHCDAPRTVSLRAPGETCQLASAVLVKTVCFVRSLPSYQQLPARDQLTLLRGCWAPSSSWAWRRRASTSRFWSLDLSPKEYAYLKGAMLFNPGVPQLKAALVIEGLQQEARRALRELVLPLHPQDRGRFARILLAASALETVSPNLVTELFFRPVIGPADLLELLAEMLFTR
ncbi:hypothetical protein AAFF_G00267360 [Aldrovandia affinis]|uniref:NR LBD domain-containing protein n=1 Tax=Aldrovandia affinis TaxID=143900 RepID=A0AAD7RB91_9TELE|nr:hypothetical protein AAFF_G00267360 [Aldrovandia affinis]